MRSHRPVRRFLGNLAAACALYGGLSLSPAHAAPPMRRIMHGISPLIGQSRGLGPVPADEQISLCLVLPLRNRAALSTLLTSLYTPGDPAYGHYLRPKQFTAQFGPTQADYDAVVAWVRAQGLTVKQTFAHRKMVGVTGTASAVGRAFGVELRRYLAPDGQVFYAPASEARVPAAIAARLAGVFGLDNSIRFQPRCSRGPAAPFFNPFVSPATNPFAAPQGVLHPDGGGGGGSLLPRGGTPLYGQKGGLGPYAIQAAYDLTGVPQTGAGQVLGLFELDGYTPSDIANYEQYFGITPQVPLQNILVDGFDGKPTTSGSGPVEVTLDIEMMVALAPGASQIRVYEGPNNLEGLLYTYYQIVTEDLATSVSSSWGLYENAVTGTNSAGETFYQVENDIFSQMAAQGQSMFAAAGDNGSWDGKGDKSGLIADDPAAQPYVTGVGGTTLSYNATTAAYISEVVWNNSGGAGGGGISAIWTIPTWQQSILNPNVTSNASTTMRNVPDVALNASSGAVYAIYINGFWTYAWGTSAAAPLWAAFTALVNQARLADNCPALGFANPPLYYLAEYNGTAAKPTGPNYASDFHDITIGNNNVNNNPLRYPAVTGYDDATGLGSFVGGNLLSDLTSVANTGTLDQLLGNNSFEQGDANTAPWVAGPNVIAHSPAERAHTGRWVAWLCGYGATHTDTLMQTVRIPTLATAATLSFWLHIDTQETTRTDKNDTLLVQLRDTAGNVVKQLGSYSNLDHNVGYSKQTFPLTPIGNYAGKTLQVYLVGSENGSLRTSFVLDDFALNITE